MNRSTINHFKTGMLFLAPAVLSAAIGYLLAGWVALALCAAVHASLAATAFLRRGRMVLNRYGAAYIPESQAPGLYALLSELARRAALPRPALYLLPETAPRLLVIGRNAETGAIAISKGLLQLLNTEELAAVIAHAIDHLRSGETGPMTMMAGLVEQWISLANSFRWISFLGSKSRTAEKRRGAPSDAFLWVLIAPLAAALVRATVYPSRQFRADAASAHLIGDANPLCTALAKIEARATDLVPESPSPATAHLFLCDPLIRESRMSLFRTHPPMEERLRRLDALDHLIDYPGRLMTLHPAKE